MKATLLNKIRSRRKNRTQAKIFGSKERPRLSIFRSNQFIYVQLIDDSNHKTLASASTKGFTAEEKKKKKTDQAGILGVKIAKKAIELGIKNLVLDRGAYKYHGRVKSLAEGVRSEGVKI